MKQEKTLSEKKIRIIDEVSNDGINWETIKDDDLLYVKDVKQFIKEILEEILTLKNYDLGNNQKINKIMSIIKQKAGKELVEND